MSLTLQIHLHAEADGAWTIGVGGVGERLAWGRLEAEQVTDLRARVQAALTIQGLLLPDEAEVRAGEEAAGRALGAVLSCSPGVIAQVGTALGQARGTDKTLVILVDAAEPELWSLPWELLAFDGVPLEAEGRAVIARLGPSGGAPLPGGPLQPLIWTLDQEDPDVQTLVQAIERGCREAGLPRPRPADQVDLAEHQSALLFLVTHGRGEAELVRLEGPEGDQSCASLPQALARHLPRTALAVALICDGNMLTASLPETLSERLLRAGARACLATGERLPVHAGQELVAGLLSEAGQHRVLARAVLQARGRVGALADPSPDARWWRQACVVTAAGALAWTPRPGLPPDWQPGPDALRLLEGALELADRRQQRWLGVEHLVQVLFHDRKGLSAAQVQAVAQYRADAEALADRFKLRRSQPLRPTPRLSAVVAGLPPGFSVRQLADALVRSYPQILRARFGLAAAAPPDDLGTEDGLFTDMTEDALLETEAGLGEVFEPASATPDRAAAPRPWRELEVLGGPEDGRRLTLEPGQVLGRGYDQYRAHVQLYADTGALDLRLSSRTGHLRALGGGWVELLRDCHALHTSGTSRGEPLPSGTTHLLPGDSILGLTQATWLWVVPREERGAAR